MRYREITEAPIADFQVVNKDTEKFYNDFDKSDEGIVNSQKGVQKIMNAFAKTPFDFNIYVVMRPTEGIWGHDFASTQADAKQFLQDQIGDVQTEGRITCVYLSNVTGRSNRMPMNAWTIAHRMIHMLQTQHKDSGVDLMHFEKTLWQNLIKVAAASTDIKPIFVGNMLQMASPETAMTNFATAMMTMKSAREGKIVSSLDVGGEALAQYLLTGGIRFNQFQTIAERFPVVQGNREQADTDKGYKVRNETYNIRPDADPGQINKMIYAAEKNSMVACRDTLQNMVGKVFWF